MAPKSGRATAKLERTPRQSEGPYYPLTKAADAGWDLLDTGADPGGVPLQLSGRVVDTSGRPLAGALVEIWQADNQGIYDHPHAPNYKNFDKAFRGYGEVQTGNDGIYRFRTIVPVRYTGRPPHIHVKVKSEDHETLTTQLYIKGHPDNRRDFLLARIFSGSRQRLMMDIKPASTGPGKTTTYDFVI